MKPICFVLLYIISLSTYAQKIRFTDTSNVWKVKVSYYNDMHPYTSVYTINFVGDTTIAGHLYNGFNFEMVGTPSYVRDDTDAHMVYYRDFAGDSDVLFMDYTLRVGDTFISKDFSPPTPTPVFYTYEVVSLDSIVLNSVWHKVWRFTNRMTGGHPYAPIIIEGIGCVNYPSFMFWENGVEPPIPAVYCFTTHGNAPLVTPQIFELNNTTSCSFTPPISVTALLPIDNIIIWPNPVTARLFIKSSKALNSIRITDITGRALFNNTSPNNEATIDVAHLSSGIYFVNANGIVYRMVKQ